MTKDAATATGAELREVVEESTVGPRSVQA
jgi:hypothetical protein